MASEHDNDASVDPRTELQRIALGFMQAQILYAAAEIGVADALGDGDEDVDVVAERTGADPDALHRLLRALAVLGVVRETAARRFELGPLGESLRSDHPLSLRPMIRLFGDEAVWRAWSGLAHSVRTGETAFDHVLGEGTFEYFARNPELGATFNETMVVGTKRVAPHVPATFDFSRYSTVMDVGGGSGALIAAILAATPHLEGVVFDTPAGVEAAEELLEEAGVADRCRIVTGDFFEEVPDGADVHVLKSIIHDWADPEAARILENCRQALPSDGRLLLVEPVVPERLDDDPEVAGIVMSDINMLVNTGGRERTADEFRSLLAGAGFDLLGYSETLGESQVRLIEARPT